MSLGLCEGVSRGRLKRKDLSFSCGWHRCCCGVPDWTQREGKKVSWVLAFLWFCFLTSMVGQTASCSTPSTLLWARISDTMRQNKSILTFLFLSDTLSNGWESLTQNMYSNKNRPQSICWWVYQVWFVLIYLNFSLLQD